MFLIDLIGLMLWFLHVISVLSLMTLTLQLVKYGDALLCMLVCLSGRGVE